VHVIQVTLAERTPAAWQFTLRYWHHDKEGTLMNDQRPESGHEHPYDGYMPVLHTTLRRLFTTAPPNVVPCTFRYSADDPFAVRIEMTLAPGVSVNWTVARELLQMGLQQPAGEGDFHVWSSSAQPTPGARLYFSLDRPSGQATFETDRSTLSRWLDATYKLVPAGCESELLDWQTLEASLLDTN
jgi:hypothetical protein